MYMYLVFIRISQQTRIFYLIVVHELQEKGNYSKHICFASNYRDATPIDETRHATAVNISKDFMNAMSLLSLFDKFVNISKDSQTRTL